MLRHVRAPVLSAGVVIVACVGVALATGYSVGMKAPAHAKMGVPYSVSFHGTAAQSVRWYLFVDYHRCGANPAVEHLRAAGADGTLRRGKFHHTSSGWTSSRRGTDHACVYLAKLSAPFNGSKGVLAHSFASYRIH